MSSPSLTRPWVIRIERDSTRISALWNPETPFTIGQPLRWVLEWLPETRTLRLMDTLNQRTFEKKLEGDHAAFELTSKSRLTLWREQALQMSPTLQSAELGTDDQGRVFRVRAMQSIAALALCFLALPLLPKPRQIEMVQAPVQIMELAKSMAPKPVPRTAAATLAQSKSFSSRLKSFVQGSASRWLAATSFHSFSASTFTKFTASFGNAAASGGPQVRAGLSKSEAGGGGGIAGTSDWVNLDTLAASVQEGLTKDEVGEVIHKHMKEVRYCYETAMMRVPDLEGKLVVAFTIGNAGAVKTSAVRSSTLPDSRLNDCILGRLTHWKFPKPKGGIDVAVTYPFLFKTLGK
ncbi:MAG: AgmX/PglI C-terminal domain-containing protein [Oligoflexia bacterium]